MKLVRFGEIGREKPGLIDPEGVLRSLEGIVHDIGDNILNAEMLAELRVQDYTSLPRYQDGNTRTMVFGVAYLVSYISQFMTLMPGDIISTGTPPGVGLGQKPPGLFKARRRHGTRYCRSWPTTPTGCRTERPCPELNIKKSFIPTFGVQRLWRQ